MLSLLGALTGPTFHPECCSSCLVLFVCFNVVGGGLRRNCLKPFSPLFPDGAYSIQPRLVEHSDLIDQDDSTVAGCWRETWLSRALKPRLQALDSDRPWQSCVFICYRVNSTCITFLVDKMGIMEWPYRVMRSYLLSQFISVTSVFPSTLGECVSCSRISSVQQWWCLWCLVTLTVLAATDIHSEV